MVADVKTRQMFMQIIYKIIKYFEFLNFCNQRAVIWLYIAE
jgi:hypothetical protein